MTALVHEELYCSLDDAGEAAEGGVVTAGGFILYCTEYITVQCSCILIVIQYVHFSLENFKCFLKFKKHFEYL